VTPTATATPAPLRVEVTWLRNPVAQGRTTTLRVTTNHPSRVTGTLAGQPLRFLDEGVLGHVALIGVGAIAPIEAQSVEIVSVAEGGQSLTLITQLQVVAGEYAHEMLYFEPSVAALLDPAISVPEAQRAAALYQTFSPEVLWRGEFAWPLVGQITSEFGTRRQYQGGPVSFHGGLDLHSATDTTIRAPAEGMVILAEELKVRGRAVFIDHGAGVVSAYYHMESLAVKTGQRVERGDALGIMGATGLVTGAHLHWELQVNGVAVDPQEWTVMRFP
jgi:murein DD-endopeptidase MepM/ murein hydrolase activator NlpD